MQDGWIYRLILADKIEDLHFDTYDEAWNAQREDGLRLRHVKYVSCILEWREGHPVRTYSVMDMSTKGLTR
jgi:hypothetical protein